jgi:D-tyrosyl-tRNA(Tyr) deacylase
MLKRKSAVIAAKHSFKRQRKSRGYSAVTVVATFGGKPTATMPNTEIHITSFVNTVARTLRIVASVAANTARTDVTLLTALEVEVCPNKS